MCPFIPWLKTSAYPWVWILWILQRICRIREYHCISIIQLEPIYSFIYASQMQSLCYPLCVSLLKYYSWIFYFFQSNNSLDKKKMSVHWCSATQPKDRLWLNLWMFYVSNEVFIIAWNISIYKCKAEGLEPSNCSVEAQSTESQSEKQLHLSDILKSNYILCEK